MIRNGSGRREKMTREVYPFNTALCTQRKLRGWFQAKLAELIGASEEMISKWERGKKRTSPYYQEKLCVLFGMNAEELGFLLPEHQLLVVTGEITQTSLDPSLTLDSTQQATFLHMTQRESSSGLPNYSQGEMSQKEITRLLQEQLLFSLSPEQVELLYLLDQRDNEMAFNSSKRDTLRKIAAAFTIGPLAITDLEPWERLSMAQRASSPSSFLNATTLEHFQHLLLISWQLCNENQLVIAEEVLGSFLPQLLSLHAHDPRISLLAASGLYLQSMFAHHHLRLSDKVRLCEQSMSYAHEASDTNTLVSALIELALAYEYTRQPEKRLAALQEALVSSCQASPLVQSLTYSEYAAALAENKRVREAQLYMGLAEEVFPDDPTKDSGFAFSDGNIFCFSYRAGLVHIHAGSISQAFSAFEHYKQHRSGIVIPERLRLLIANGQSRAAIRANDAERYAYLLEDVLVGAVRIGSQKRFDEALVLFHQEMPTSWLSFSRIKHLSEQYDLRREA